VLTVTEMLRQHGVVGRFVEYCGTGLSSLSLADRATLGNMSPEYGATAGFFPVDDETLKYLRLTGRGEDLVELVEKYCKANGLFRTDETPDPEFNELLELDLGTVVPSLAGPRRPQDRVALGNVQQVFRSSFEECFGNVCSETVYHGYDEESAESFPASDPPTAMAGGTSLDADESRSPEPTAPATATADRLVMDPSAPRAAEGRPVMERVGEVPVVIDGQETMMHHGSVAIAAITSCTNTSNPSVMLGAGLLAKKAIERGLDSSPYVKTSMAPGSQVVTRYLQKSGLIPYLSALGFHVVGYGCTTCIGNSGPLPEPVAEAVDDNGLIVASVLSGNRNFEGRIHPQVRASFLASPPLVVAYALAGTVDIDLTTEPVGYDPNGDPVYLHEIWPTDEEVRQVMGESVDAQMFREEYGSVFEGDERWRGLPVPEGDLYAWDAESTYVQEPPYFVDMAPEPGPAADIVNARVLALLGDSVTTDHISPAGSIAPTSPAGQYLTGHGVERMQFNSYGSRRGNHEVMIRGTFANIRLRNQLTPGKEGTWTKYLPTGEEMTIYDAAMRHKADGTPLVVIAGKEYGTGSSRDWAAKGTILLGVRTVIAESFERIHRSNLVGMGVLPLQFKNGESAKTHGLTGKETFEITGLTVPDAREATVIAKSGDGEKTFTVRVMLLTPKEREFYRHGGILQYVLRQLASKPGPAATKAA
jgi:aconitate hydratase